jgi:serine/threonine-protein kinase
MAAILRAEPAPLNTQPELSRVILRCLQKSPSDRYQTTKDLKAALLAVSLSGVSQSGLAPVQHDAQPSIAVLPFADMSSGQDSEYFGDGLAEEIINALTRIPNFKVIARTSAFAFKGKQEDIRKIAEVLGVANILEGSVRRAGNRVRIAAQLITAADGSHLWSERFDRDMSDIFAIQDEISLAIADALKTKLGPRAQHELVARPTANIEAYQAYLEGNHHLAEMSPASTVRSLECFERSIQLDPNYAAPWAAIGERAINQALYIGLRPRDVIPAGLAAVDRALKLNPEAAEAYHIRGLMRAFYEWNWGGAEEDFSRAIELNPAFALAHVGKAIILAAQRRAESALAEISQALDLDPLNMTTRRTQLHVLYATGNGKLAVERARALVDLSSGSWLNLAFAARAFTLQGLLEEADATLQRGLELSPRNVQLLAWLAFVRGRQGRVGEAERIRAEMESTTAQQYVPFWLRAQASEGCGDMEQAYRFMDQSLDERELNAPIWLIARRPDFGSDPRYQAHLRRINLA